MDGRADGEWTHLGSTGTSSSDETDGIEDELGAGGVPGDDEDGPGEGGRATYRKSWVKDTGGS